MSIEKLSHRETPIAKESLIKEGNGTRQVHSLLFQGCKGSRVQETCSDSDRKINSYLHMEDKVQKDSEMRCQRLCCLERNDLLSCPKCLVLETGVFFYKDID